MIRNTGRGQQVDLVVDDQAPVALVEQVEVGEVAVLLGPVGDDLVGGQRDRRDRLGVAGVGGDHRLVEVGLVEDLAPPLLDGGGAGGQDEGLVCRAARAARPDDRLARAAGQDDHARAAPDVAPGVERVDGHLLVVADPERQPRPRRLAEADPERRPLGVAGEVLGRIADGDQGLLEDAAEGVVDGEAGRVDPLAEVVAHPLLPRQLLEQRLVLGDQPELAVDPLEPDPAVAADQLAEVGRQVGGNGKLADKSPAPRSSRRPTSRRRRRSRARAG